MPDRSTGGAAALASAVPLAGRAATCAGIGALAHATLSLVAGCGQKGPLVRREVPASTAVTISGPAAGESATPSAAAAATPAPDAPVAAPRSDDPDAPRRP